MTAEAKSAKDLSKPVFWGFMFVGFLSLLGGIAMFVYVVPQDLDRNAAPRDAGVLFTEVFMQQLELFQANHRYSASLSEVILDHDTCERYNCRLIVRADALDYVFRLRKDAKTWAITPKSPVPVLEK